MSASLVGSEMCIRDSDLDPSAADNDDLTECFFEQPATQAKTHKAKWMLGCLLYTSDAADDM
eukprot:6100958-Alexandrium_andersonii.AAC.1